MKHNHNNKTTMQTIPNLLHLFKKIALVDKILVVTVLLGFAFFAVVFFRKADFITATIKVNEDNALFGDWLNYSGTRPWFVEVLHKGASQKDGLGRIVAEVISVNSYYMRPNRVAVYVKTRLKVTYNRASNQYTFGGLPLTIGSTIKMGFDTVAFDGLVTNIEGVPDFRQKVKLKIEARLKDENLTYLETSGVSMAVANEIQNINEIKDGEGNLIMRVLQKHIENADTVTTNSDGKVLIQKDPLRKDVYLTLEINAVKIGERYFLFDDMPILIGEKIPLNTDKLSVFPEITKIILDEK